MAIDINIYGGPGGLTARELQLGRQCAELRQLLKAAEDELQERRSRERREDRLAAAWRSARLRARQQRAILEGYRADRLAVEARP